MKIVIQKNADDETLFDVKTLLDTTVVDEQTVSSAAELKENKFVKWKSDAALEATSSAPLTGGANGTVNGQAHQSYLDKIES